MSERRVLTISSTGHVAVRRESAPEQKPGHLLVRVSASAISPGTELMGSRGRTRESGQESDYRPFGYQNAGRVMAVGEGCRGFRIGGRVACMGANFALHTDIACIPQNLAVPLPDSMSDEVGAFVALAATAMHAARRGEVVFGEEVSILGLGMVGQLISQVCHATGAHLLALDPIPLRQQRASRCGIGLVSGSTGDDAVRLAEHATGGQGMDCGFLCFGGEATPALKQLARMMKQAPDTHRWGRIVIVGGAQITHGFGADLGNLDLRSAARTGPGYHDHDYEIGADYPGVFVRWTTRAHLELFVRWVAEGKLNIRDLITDRVPLQDAPEACYALMDSPADHLGVVITYGG